jgi:hypothetical protein
VTRVPQTLAVVDAGGATTSVSLLARVDRRWRLLGSLAAPIGTPEGALLAILAERARAADPDLAVGPELKDAALERMPRLSARSRPQGTLVVLAASRRSVGDLAAVATRTGWHVVTASTESHDPREMTELALGREVGAVLIGAGDPAGPDERAALDDLAALGGAVARRRPEMPILLGGAIRGRRAWVSALGENAPGDPARIIHVRGVSGRRGDGDEVRLALEALLHDPEDGRRAMRASAETLADLLDRRVELVEVGFNGGTRILAEPGASGSGPTSEGIVTAEGSLVPREPDDEIVDGVLAWTTGSLDRHRMSDRLRELRRRPWVDAAGDGARLRVAAASAALARIAALSPELTARPTPDLTIVAGGAFAAAPVSATALAVADTIRRTGVTQLAWDHARLLGPIGTIEDANERRALLADLVRDALVPLGSIIVAGSVGMPKAGFRRGRRPAGQLTLDHDGQVTRRDLTAGELAFIDLPPGARAEARLEFPDVVRFGRRTRHVAVPVTGGLAGLILDLRDVPLRLPERRDRRRTLLADWSALAWPGDDR